MKLGIESVGFVSASVFSEEGLEKELKRRACDPAKEGVTEPKFVPLARNEKSPANDSCDPTLLAVYDAAETDP